MSAELINTAHELLRASGRNDLADAIAENYGKIVSLRAELTEARRQLKEASEQEPVGCMSPEQFSILTVDPVDNGVHVRIWQVYNPPSRAKSGVKLYAAPVPQPAVSQSDIVRVYVGESPMPEEAPPPDGVTLFARVDSLQPAVPEVVRKLIEQLLSDYESATDEEYSGTSYYAGRVEFQNRARAILSATDSEVKNG